MHLPCQCNVSTSTLHYIVSRKTHSRRYSAWATTVRLSNRAVDGCHSTQSVATGLNWCGRALKYIACQRFSSAVILWHWVVPKSSDQTPSVSSGRSVDHGGRVGPGPQCFMWMGSTVKWTHPIFNTSEIAYGMCKTFLGCLCSSVFHVVFIIVACAGRDAGT